MQEVGPPARRPLRWSRGPGTAGVLKRGWAWRGLGGSAPSEVPTGLPVSTPALGQQGLAPPAEPSTGPGSRSKTEAGCRALGVLPELSFISWISGRLLGAVGKPPQGMPTLQPQAAFLVPREPHPPLAGAAVSVWLPEWRAAGREALKPYRTAGRRCPAARVTERSPRAGQRLLGENRQWPRPHPGSGPTLSVPGPHGPSGVRVVPSRPP